MADTSHFTAMDAYRAVFKATKETMAYMDPPSEIDGDALARYREMTVDGGVDFATLADHINAAIAEAVKAEREACAEIAMNEGIKREDQNAPRIATAIRARGAK